MSQANQIPRHILMIDQHFYPEVAATAQMMTDLAMDLVKKGYQDGSYWSSQLC